MAVQQLPKPLSLRSYSHRSRRICSFSDDDSCDPITHDSAVDLSSDDTSSRILNYSTQFTQRPSRTALGRRRATAPIVHSGMDAVNIMPSTPTRLAPPPRLWEGSPYSDYFSEAGDSPPKTLGLQLVQRLNNIGARIALSGLDDHLCSGIDAKLAALEYAICHPDTPSKVPAGMVDSGVFLDGESEKTAFDFDITPSPVKEHLFNGVQTGSGMHSGNLLRQAQDVLTRVTKANAELRLRFKELKTAHDSHLNEKDEALHQLLHLRTQNDELRSTLSFTHSDLLLLSLQLKGLQVQTSPYLAELPEDETVMKAIERWKVDWKEVDDRLKSRMQNIQRRDSGTRYIGNWLSEHEEENTQMSKWRKDTDGRLDEAWPSVVDVRRLPFEEAKQWTEDVDDISTEASTAVDAEDLVGSKQADDSQKQRQKETQDPPNLPIAKQDLHSSADAHPPKRAVAIRKQKVVQDCIEEESLQNTKQPPLTPWQELCHSLAVFAGMADD